MNNFNDKKYFVYRNLISNDHAAGLANQFKMLSELALFQTNNDKSKFYDKLVTDHCFVWYAPVDHLLEQVQPKIQDVVGKNLLPTYSFGRIYYKSAVMKEHIDRPACEYSVTLNASIDKKPWPIWIKNLEGIDIPIDLYPGDALIYMGQFLTHWRNPYVEGDEQIQFFLHWVDANGANTEWKFDKRPGLGFPVSNTANHE
jgi:hypothetical protein